MPEDLLLSVRVFCKRSMRLKRTSAQISVQSFSFAAACNASCSFKNALDVSNDVEQDLFQVEK